MSIQLHNKIIGYGAPAFMIAELSGNHHQKYEEAEALVHAAADAGADAIKLQTYTPDTITLNSDREWFIVGGKDQPDAWKRRKLYDLYGEAYTPWEWQPKLKELTESLGMEFFSSAFDETAVDFLEDMGVLFYKVASYEAIHIPLIKKIAQTKKPVIISIGFASEEEASLAVETLKKYGSGEIVVLHCVTAYSDNATLSHMNLRTIDDIQNRFGVLAGFSDNNGGIVAPVIAATIAGACAVEKHLILDRSLAGPDARFSLEPGEFKEMVARVRRYEAGDKAALSEIASEADIASALGHVQYGPATEQEAENTLFRPSIWVKKEIKKGDPFTLENIRVARPKHGLAPKYFEEALGKHAATDIEAATPLSWDMVEGGEKV